MLSNRETDTQTHRPSTVTLAAHARRGLMSGCRDLVVRVRVDSSLEFEMACACIAPVRRELVVFFCKPKEKEQTMVAMSVLGNNPWSRKPHPSQ